MNPASPAPSPRRRWPGFLHLIPNSPTALVAAALLTAALAGVVIGESLGWPFLRAPVQRWLSAALERRVDLAAAAASDGAQTTAFAVRFIGGLKLHAPRLEIAPPAWSNAPHMLLASDVSMALRYGDLWRAHRGQPLKIKRLQARTLDAELIRLADGRASWHFGPQPVRDAAEPLPLLDFRSFGELQVDQGVLRYRDAPLAIEVEARVSLLDGAGAATSAQAPAGASAASAATSGAAPDSVLRVDVTGQFRQRPLKATLLASGVLPWAADTTQALELPVTLSATMGQARLEFKGRAADALHLSALSGQFSLSGPSLAAVGDPVGVTLPTTAAFRSRGIVVRQGDVWRVLLEDATVGKSRLNGAFTYEARRSVPLLSGRLGGSRLFLSDLGPVVGTTPSATAPAPGVAALPSAAAASAATRVASNADLGATAGAATKQGKGAATGKRKAEVNGRSKAEGNNKSRGKVLPDRPFDLAALRAMDANVLIDIADVDLDTRLLEPLRPLHAHLQLAGGVLTLSDLDARTGGGQLKGELALDGRGAKALWRTDLRWDGVRLERWIRQGRADAAPPWVSGRMNGRAVLQGQGRSTAEILASLDGSVRSELRDGSVSHLFVEAAGVDLAESLGLLIKGDKVLPVQCAVADLAAKDGVFRPRIMGLDTSDSAVWVDGSLSLATETMDLRAVVSPKDFSPLTLRTPLRVRGSFADPQVSLDKGPMARKLAGAFLLSLINPLAALLPLIDTGNAEAAERGAVGCQALLQRHAARVAARGAAVAR